MSSYFPFISTFAHVWSGGVMAPGTDINVAQVLQPVDLIMATDVGNPALTTASFVRDDRPRVLRVGLFANFADGMLLDGLLAPDALVAGALYLNDSTPAAGLQAVIPFRLPSLNAWYDVEASLAPVFQLPAGGLRYYATINCDFATDIVDASLAGREVSFQLCVQAAHTFGVI